jgi:hypothetical protein
MVRKGSGVRVPQRACAERAANRAFRRFGGVDPPTLAEHPRNTAPSPGRHDAPAGLAFGVIASSVSTLSSAGALDLLLGGHALRRVEVLPDAGVVAQQGRRAVA